MYWRVLELRKICFRGLKGPFDVKNANFMRLIAKNGYFWPILAYRTHLWPIFMDYAIGIVAPRYVRGILQSMKLGFRGSQRTI